MNATRLIDAWIKMHSSEEGSSDYENNFWAYSELDRLIDDQPEYALSLIFSIAQADESDLLTANLAAGPLEDLLVRHGERVIGHLIHKFKSHARFKPLLKNVWRNNIPAPVWDALKKELNS